MKNYTFYHGTCSIKNAMKIKKQGLKLNKSNFSNQIGGRKFVHLTNNYTTALGYCEKEPYPVVKVVIPKKIAKNISFNHEYNDLSYKYNSEFISTKQIPKKYIKEIILYK